MFDDTLLGPLRCEVGEHQAVDRASDRDPFCPHNRYIHQVANAAPLRGDDEVLRLLHSLLHLAAAAAGADNLRPRDGRLYALVRHPSPRPTVTPLLPLAS